MLVAYAGKDPTEVPVYVSEYKFLHRQCHTRSQRAYRMFLAGADTFDIAKAIDRSEATVLRMITAERCERLELSSAYEEKPSNRILVVQGVRGDRP